MVETSGSSGNKGDDEKMMKRWWKDDDDEDWRWWKIMMMRMVDWLIDDDWWWKWTIINKCIKLFNYISSNDSLVVSIWICFQFSNHNISARMIILITNLNKMIFLAISYLRDPLQWQHSCPSLVLVKKKMIH